MLSERSYDISQLRDLSTLISHAAFRRLSTNSNQSSYIRRMKKYVGWNELSASKPVTLKELIAYSYGVLEQNYRHEYIYKNKLLNDYILKYYSLHDSVLLNEFKISGSIADAILINGTDKVFEIKTELDNAERLHTQLEAYYKAFSQVYLFTHYTLSDYYLQLLPSYVGLLTYTEGGQVKEVRNARSHFEKLDVKSIMASLRKPEYLALVSSLLGYVPDVAPAFLYRACLDALAHLPVVEIQKAYFQILKDRINPRINEYIEASAIPHYLNFSFYQQKIDNNSYLTLVENLNKNLKY